MRAPLPRARAEYRATEDRGLPNEAQRSRRSRSTSNASRARFHSMATAAYLRFPPMPPQAEDKFALACLKEIMGAPSRMIAQEIRHDPRWVRFKDDPRFEPILRSAKTL